MLDVLEDPGGYALCATCTLEAVEDRLCLLEVPEVMRCVLLCMLEDVEGTLCLLEVLYCLYAGCRGGWA